VVVVVVHESVYVVIHLRVYPPVQRELSLRQAQISDSLLCQLMLAKCSRHLMWHCVTVLCLGMVSVWNILTVFQSGINIMVNVLAQKYLCENNSYAHDDQGGNSGQATEGSTVSSIKCDCCWHLD